MSSTSRTQAGYFLTLKFTLHVCMASAESMVLRRRAAGVKRWVVHSDEAVQSKLVKKCKNVTSQKNSLFC